MYLVAMSQGRFKYLLNCVRFTDPETQEERWERDKFAPFRQIWDSFIQNCGKMYMPSKNPTVSEQLLEFKGRCPFCMDIHNKPAKYGIKLVLANNNKSSCLPGGIPYLGKQGTRHQDGQSLGHYSPRS